MTPIRLPCRTSFLAASRSRAVGDRFIASFNDRVDYFPWMADLYQGA